jgi:hypothetical protein
MRRTSGDDFCRRRSSTVGSASPPPLRSRTAAPCGGDAAGLDGDFAGTPSPCGAALAGGPDDGASVGAGAAAASPAAPMVATTLFTGTVSPSLTAISSSVPAAGDGISASTLSVEISNSGSSRSTVSPTFLIQRTMVPSAIDSPIWGITTGVDMTASRSLR